MFTSNVYAEVDVVAALQKKRAEEASHYCVKVRTENANVFTQETHGGHGSGFIVDLKNGIIATNKHVVEKEAVEAQRIILEFPSGTRNARPERIQGQVVYISEATDIAFIRFNPKDLKRVRKRLRAAELAKPEELQDLIVKGNRVMVFGWPESSEEAANFGAITGVDQAGEHGRREILTEASINLGNSGGPMIETSTGKVVGINFAIEENAENMGFAIPIDIFWQEFEEYNANRSSGANSYLFLQYSEINGEQMQEVPNFKPLVELILQEVPDFFERFDSVLFVSDSRDESGLKQGDVILRANGEVVGDQEGRIEQLIHRSRSEMTFQIIRDLKIRTIKVSLMDLRKIERHQKVDYVEFSGIVVQDQTPDELFAVASGTEGVIVRAIRPNTYADKKTALEVDSVITNIATPTRNYPIRHLRDLKTALRHIQEGNLTFIFYMAPLQIPANEDKEDAEEERYEDAEGNVALNRVRHMSFVVLKDIQTSNEIPLQKLLEAYDFTGLRLRPKVGESCANFLQGLEGSS